MGLIAIREDEDKAATVGVNTPTYKMLAFVASAVFVGMAGGVYGYYLGFLDPLGMFNILLSVQIVLSLLLGGRGTLWGPVLGAFMIESAQRDRATTCSAAATRGCLIFGGLLVLVVLFLPRGILPTADALDRALARARQGGPGGRAADRHRPARARGAAPAAAARRPARRCSR